MTDLHELANVMLALRCATGTAARDVDDCHTVVREPCYLMARNLVADPGPLLAALGIVGVTHPDGFDVAAYHAESNGCGWYEVRTDGSLAPGVEALYRRLP